MPEGLCLLSSIVEDWSGQGPVVIQWTAAGRADPLLPVAEIIADFASLPRSEQAAARRAACSFFSRPEALALASYLNLGDAASARVSVSVLDLPLHLDEALALAHDPDLASDPRVLAMVRASPAVAPPPLPFLGVVSRWPWPALEPGEVLSLIGTRERLGLRPPPMAPLPARANPRPGA